jgi:hypothetical protein
VFGISSGKSDNCFFKKTHYLVILICLVVLGLAGFHFVYYQYLWPEDLRQNQLQNPGSPINQTGPGSICNPQAAAPRIPVPVDTSIQVRDPMPGIRYSFNESESGRTIELRKGEIVEINLRWAPGLANSWDVPVSGCSLELVNDGYYDTGTDFWNTSGHYRARYRAISPGTSIIDGIFAVPPRGTAHEWNPRFNLTVIVK